MWIKFGLPYFKCYYQPAGPLISPHVLPPVATGPPPPLGNVSLLPAAPASGSNKKQIPTPLGSDPEHLHAAPPSTTSAADSTDSDVLITGGDLTPFRYPPSSGAPSAHHTAPPHQLHPQAHPGSPYQRSMHAAQMHYLTAYPPNYYSPYPGEAMCYSPPAAAYQPYFPTKVYQSGPPHPPPGAYRRYSYYPPGHPPPAEIYEQGPPPPPPPPPGSSGGSSSQPGAPSSASGGAPQSQQQQPPPPTSQQGPTGSQLVPAGPVAHAQHLEHYPGPPGYYAGYSPGGGAAGQCYTRSLQTPYMDYPPQCPCPMQQSCPKNVNTGPHIGSNNGGSINSHINTANGNSICNSTVMTHNSNITSSSNNCLNSSSNSIVNGSQSKSSSNKLMNSSNTLTNAESNHSGCSNNNNNNTKNSMNTSRGPVKNKTTSNQQEQQKETNTNRASLYHQQQQDHQPLRTTVKSELKTEESDCKSQYEDHVVQPPTPPESYGTNEEKALLIEDEVMDAAIERLKMSRLAAETAATTSTTQTNSRIMTSTTSPATMPGTIEAYDLTSPVMSTTTATNNTNGGQQSSVVGRKARIGKTMAREMVYAAAATAPATAATPTTQSAQHQQQQQQMQHPLIQVRTLPQQNAASNSNSTTATTSPLTVPSLLSDTLAESLPLLASIKTEIKAEHIKLEDEALEAILQQQQHISSNTYHTHHQNHQSHELKIKTEPMSLVEDTNQNEDDELVSGLRLGRQELESNAEQTKPMLLSKTSNVSEISSSNSSKITMPRPISEGRMRLLSNWQQPPKINCEIDLSTVSDDDVFDLCQSPTTSTDNGAKRIKIIDFQNGSTQSKKSSPSGYKNLIKQAEPKAYLCLSRRRIEKRNRYVKLQRAANMRRRQISYTQRKKLTAAEKKRKEVKSKKRIAARQLLLEAEQQSSASEAHTKTESTEAQQSTDIIDLVQEHSSNETPSTSSYLTAKSSINSPKHRLQDSPKASPKRAVKPKKTTALPLHLIETIDAVARGYYSEPETRCSSVLSSTFSTEKPSTVTATTTTLSPSPLAQSSSSTRKPKAKANSVEKRSKSETKKPIKGTQQTFPALAAFSLPAIKTTATEMVTKATSTQAVAESSNAAVISDPIELPSLTKLKNSTKKPKTEAKSKAKVANKNAKAKPKSTKQTKASSKTCSTNSEAVPTTSLDNNAEEHQKTTNADIVNSTINDDILLETNNNEILDKQTSIMESSSQSPLEIIFSSKDSTSNCSSDKPFETPTDDAVVAAPTQQPTSSTQNSSAAGEQLKQTSGGASAVVALSHSDNAQVFVQPALPPRILCHSHHYHGKRTRSRTKFGPRKRQKQKHSIVSYELDERIPLAPRSDVIPKWNNGWNWEGEPFQGAVFLNSDDPLVIRTCYPAMRHSEGDIIRTRDCVLLKANEDNELPYVAKVAHLWENPEDGEMMVSLLWYYRPEHTEQGRQTSDSPDEVYASRHRDHNSVACIEDKCYVLTFSEYCRYRRRLRANEEDLEDVTIVPKPVTSFYNTQKVPDNTNPELVMFCRRAYEFRTRRLLKMPNKQDYYVVNV